MSDRSAREADLGSDAQPPYAHPDAVDRPIVELVLAHVRDRPEAIAVADEEGELSYAALAALAARIAKRVAEVAPGNAPIGILMPISRGYIAAIIALLARGIPYVPLDEEYPAARTTDIAMRAGLQAIIVSAAGESTAAEIAPDLPRIVMPEPSEEEIVPLEITATPDDVAVIFYTSGSTGHPKGVYQSQRATAYEVLLHCSRAGLRHDDRIALLYSPAAAGSTRDIHGSLLAGATLCLVDIRRQGGGKAMRLLADWDATVFHAMPGLFRAVFSASHPDTQRLTRSVRLVHLISDRVLTSDVALFQRRFPRSCRLCIDIAATEISSSSYASWYLDHDTVIERDLVPVGYPRRDMILTLVDGEGQEVPCGQLGEIIVSGHSLALGYWNDAEATAKAFSPSLRLAGGIDYRTGDLGRMLPGCLLEFVGRRDRQVKIRGYTVHLAEVEAGLMRCPGLLEVGALVRRRGADTRLIAYCVSAAGANTDRTALAAWCAVNLPVAMRPQEITMLDALPRLPNGKPDAGALAALDEKIAGSKPITHGEGVHVPESEAERAVRDAWAELLDPGTLDANVSFEEAGGDSLKAMNLMLLLEERLGVMLAADILDLKTTPSELIARLGQPAANPRHAANPDMPALVIFPGIFGADLDAGDFARRMANRFAVTMVDYRWGGDDLAGAFSAERLIGEVVDRVTTASTDRLWLMGHSFGGKLAVEVARRLLDAGVTIEQIVILDGVPTDDKLRSRETIHRIDPARARVRKGVRDEGIPGFIRKRLRGRAVWTAGAAARGLVVRRRYRLARWLIAVLDNRWSREAHLSARRWTIAKTRSLAFAHLPVKAQLPAELTLFVSCEQRYAPSLYPDLGWKPYFARVVSITVDIRHAEFFKPEKNAAFIQLLDERLADH